MRLSRAAKTLPVAVVILIIGLCAFPEIATSHEQSGLHAAWERAHEAGSYRFAADIVQITTPLPLVTNVGLQSRQDALRIEGETSLVAETLDFTLWSQGGSVLNARSGVQVRIDGEQAVARQGTGSWEEIDDFSGLFAPGGDLMAYLASAKDIVDRGSTERAGLRFDRYTFRVDGYSFAVYMRDQIERYMAENGELPAGASLELPRQYVSMTGEGELWVGEDGLPLRQLINVRFPDSPESQVEAEISVSFSDFGQLPPTPLHERIPAQARHQVGFFVSSLAFTLLLFSHRRSRKLYACLAIVIVLSLVLTPLLQGVQAAEYSRDQAERDRQRDQEERERDALQAIRDTLYGAPDEERLAGPAALDALETDNGHDLDHDGLTDVQESVLGTNPLLSDADSAGLSSLAAAGEDGMDFDGDGLTDYQETMLGTSPEYADSDGDGITDTLELEGFALGGEWWHLDPLEVDTNRDGIDDGREWFPGVEAGGIPLDTDGDNVPDLFDRDNDGDGVPDALDLSPFQHAALSMVFDQDTPFSLVIDNLAAGELTYVEFQVRPTNPDHLWYAYNVLDWPTDHRGQVQDDDGATFYDLDPSGDRLPSENGDLRLLPMLEIRITGTPNNLPPADELESLYGIFVQDLQGDGSEQALYLPLQLTTDDDTGARVAFYAKVPYLPDVAWGNAQSVRMTWAVQALVDECDDSENSECSSYSAYNDVQIIQTYYDEWFLTGLNVREDHGYQIGVIWEDPDYYEALGSPYGEDSLILLSEALDYTFLAGRDADNDGDPDITVDELYTRFDRFVNDGPPVVPLEQRWGISDTLRVFTQTFEHQDLALYTMALTTTEEILEDNFTDYYVNTAPVTPTLLYVREEFYRSTNLDAWGNGGDFSWGGADGTQLTVDMGVLGSDSGLPLIHLAGAKWTPYRRVGGAWEVYPIHEYWAELERTYEHLFDDVTDPDEARGLLMLYQFYYLGLSSGMTRVIEYGDLPGLSEFAAPELSGDAELANSILGKVGTVVTFLANKLALRLGESAQLITKFLGTVGSRWASSTVGDMNPSILRHIYNLKGHFLAARYSLGRLIRYGLSDQAARIGLKISLPGLAAGGAAIGAILALVTGTALMIANQFIDSDALLISGTVLVGTGLLIMQVALPLYSISNLVSTLKAAGQTTVQAVKTVMSSSSSVIGATTAASVVGLVITLAITLAFFIYQVAQGGMNSIEVSMLIARAIAQTVVAVIYFVLSFTVVGTIVVAILSFLDLIVGLLGQLLGFGDYTISALLAKVIYGYEMISEPDIDIGGLDIQLVDPAAGMIEGNHMMITATVDVAAVHTDPDDPRAVPYIPILWTENMLRSTTISTSLTFDSEDIEVSRDDMSGEWNVSYDHTYLSHSMRRAEVVNTHTEVFELQAGINVTRPIYLNTGYALPLASCWFGIPVPPLWYPAIPVCYDDGVEDYISSNIGNSIVFDVFPDTLDEFYALDWADFGTQRDWDGDGLLSVAVGGNDPDDSTWDADGDGLSDYYEVLRRSRGGADGASRPSPNNPDTDGDGLCDGDELRLGTFPNMRDSDGDGLNDNVEVFHQECGTSNWTGGWDFSVAGMSFTAHFSSNPLSPDDDYDGLDDLAEHTLMTNPKAWTPSPLVIRTSVNDDDRIFGPGQSLVYTATVENHIELDPGLFLMGNLTLTLPSRLSGGPLTDTFNIYQQEADPLVANLAVDGAFNSESLTIYNEAFARMHDGDLNTYYAFDSPLDPRGERAVNRNSYVNMAPAIDPASADVFAIASIEGANDIGFRYANATIPASDADPYTEDRPGPGLLPRAQYLDARVGLACNDDGDCLTVWGNTHYHYCTYVTFNDLYCINDADGWSNSAEYSLQMIGSEIWWGGDIDTGETHSIDVQYDFCYSVPMAIWETDPAPNKDDYVGGITLNYYTSPAGWVSFYEPDGDGAVSLDYDVHLTEYEGIYGALLDQDGAVQGMQAAISVQGPEGHLRQRPAVASDGTDFLVVWEEYLNDPSGESANYAIYARQVYAGGGGWPAIQRLDAASSYEDRDDFYPDVTWAGGNYVVVWGFYSNQQVSPHIRVARVAADGVLLDSFEVLTMAGEGWGMAPKAAYNPQTGEVMVIYATNNDSTDSYRVRTFLVDPVSGYEYNHRTLDTLPGGWFGDVSISYEPAYGGFLATWEEGIDIINYAALGPDGTVLTDKQGRGPTATHTEQIGSITVDSTLSHDSACSYQTTDFAQCDIVATSGYPLADGTMYLQPLYMEDISPWLGTIRTMTETVLYVDADRPTSGISLTNNSHYPFTGTVIIGGTAHDPGPTASGIAGVEISIDSGPYTPTIGADSWAYAWRPPTVDGPVTLGTRATDRVGLQEAAPSAITIYLDRRAPNTSITDNGIISATGSGTNWRVALDGTVADPGGSSGSGVASVEVMLTPNGNGWQTATLAGGNWSLDYLLPTVDDAGFIVDDPTGVYTILARATDSVGNLGLPTSLTLYIDNTAPDSRVTYTGPSAAVISTTLSIAGVITDPTVSASGLQGLEVSFTPFSETPSTWLPATLTASGAGVTATTWTRAVPAGLEGSYQIDLSGTDWLGNRNNDRSTWGQWQGEIDTLAPRVAISMTYRGAGVAAQTAYEGWAMDLNLTEIGFQFPCPIQNSDRRYYSEDWWTDVTSNTQRLYTLSPECIVNGFAYPAPAIGAYDLRGAFSSVTATLPTSYLTPTVASAVLTPTHEQTLDSALPMTLTIGAYAQDHLRALTVTVDSAIVISDTLLPCTPITDVVTSTLWAVSWDPPTEGIYTLVSVAEDCSGTLQSELQPISVTVDTQPPAVEVTSLVVTEAHRLSYGRVALLGTASDTVGLEAVEVFSNTWEPADFNGTTWRYPWYLGVEPDNESYSISARAVDGAGRTTQIARSVVVDLVPPAPVDITLAYNAGSGPVAVTAGEIVRHASATMIVNWTASSDGSGVSGYYVGWSNSPTPDLGALSPYGGAGSHQEIRFEPQALYAHVVIRDVHGNQRTQTVGPVYLDGATTPDYVSSLTYHGWMETDCTQIGADYELVRNAYTDSSLADVQRMYLSWDSNGLRMTWTGANWNSDGDLFIYLDTGVGGSDTAYDPYGFGPSIGLPADGGTQMYADYLIMVENSVTARFYTASGGTWVYGSDLGANNFRLDDDARPQLADIYIPWTWLGSPASLKLVALASEEHALRVWAAIPDKNPLNSDLVVDAVSFDYLDSDFALTQYYQRSSLGGGACPNSGQFVDADLQVSFAAEPPGVEAGFLRHDLASLLTPGQNLDNDLDGVPDVELPMDLQPVLMGDGQTIVYTLRYTNTGLMTATGALATISARGGVELQGGSPQAIPLPHLGGQLLITGTVDGDLDPESAEVSVVVEDASHGDFEWLWVQHGIDMAPPHSLVIDSPVEYVNPYTNTIRGTVEDASPVPMITVQVRTTAGAVVTTLTCPDATPSDGMWTCAWNVGGAADGTQFDLYAKATDYFGNTTPAWTPAHRVTVDSTPPSIYLSTQTEGAFADNLLDVTELGLTGYVQDDRYAGSARICIAPLGEDDALCTIFRGTVRTDRRFADWFAAAPVLGQVDGVWQTFSFYGTDKVGNTSLVPLTRTAQVDIVAPAVTVTTALAGIMQTAYETILDGTISDGLGVDILRLHMARPDGSVEWIPLDTSGGAWSYSASFNVLGRYTLGLVATDLAGNERIVGPFRLNVYAATDLADLSLAQGASTALAVTGQPLTYTFSAANAGPAMATTSTLTVTLPSQIIPATTSHTCSQVADLLVCDLGDIAAGGGVTVEIAVDLPLTSTGALLSSAFVRSSKVDLHLSDNTVPTLTIPSAQPITGLYFETDAPTVLGEPTTLSVTMFSGTGVRLDWSFGDAVTTTTLSSYETGLTPTLTHVYPDVGVYTAIVTVSNVVNTVVATAVVTTDIPVGSPFFYEDFEGAFLPSGWLRTEWQEDENWQATALQAHGGLYSAMYDDFLGPQDGWLVTPRVTPTLGSELIFWQYQNYGFLYTKHSIWVSLGSCDPRDGEFVELLELGPGVEDSWEEVRADLSGLAGQTVCLAFRYEGDWDDEWYIDDVQVTANLVLAHDGPTSWGATTTMTATIATGSNVVYDWRIDDGYTNAGSVITRTFPAPGDYTAVVTASNSVSAITATMTVPIRDVIYLPMTLRNYPPPCMDDYEPDDSVAKARPVDTTGVPQHHTFHLPGDVDWVSFDVPDANVNYVIETLDLAGADTVIYLYDSDGARLLDWNDDAGPDTQASRLYFDPYHAGTFYLQVVDYNPAVGGCGVQYSLRVDAQP